MKIPPGDSAPALPTLRPAWRPAWPFDGRFLPAAAPGQLISAADVVPLPYDSREQVTSRVLIEAVTA